MTDRLQVWQITARYVKQQLNGHARNFSFSSYAYRVRKEIAVVHDDQRNAFSAFTTSVFPKRDYCYYYHYYYHHYYYHHRHYQKVTTIRNALKLKSMEEH